MAAVTGVMGVMVVTGVTGCTGKGPSQPGAQSEERQSEAEYDVAREFFGKHQYRAALDHARKAVELSDENAKAAYLTSVVYLAFCANEVNTPDCKLPEAERYARLAVKADDHFRDAKNLLGNVLILEKKYKDAIEVLEPLTKDPAYIESHLAWGNLGWAQTEAGQLDAAVLSLKNAVTQPRFCVGHYRLGLAYEKKNDLPQAETSYSNALAVESPDCQGLQDAWDARGRVRLKLGRGAEAKTDFEKCREISPKTPTGALCTKALASLGGGT
jgi:type IV pilus assembly protein PilF